ncbi:MAG: polyprenyl synthetase family protein [Phycisphaerae bacterium]|nr:polyprenyl synthetase family protein [Phycisphaerae bacterium]
MPALLHVSDDLRPVSDALTRALARVERRVIEGLESDLPPVRTLCRHVERYHGKMVRPVLALASGMAWRAADGAEDREPDPAEDCVTVAAVCELVHLATLVHDDVLDEADTRRRGATINWLKGNEAAVVLGDFLFSSAYRMCSRLGDQATAEIIAGVGRTLCAGELLQLHHRGDFSLDEATYFEIIRRKTASLISAACRLGARHAGAPDAVAARLGEFGSRLGIAFQIQDDLLDLTGDQSVVGKSLGKDLQNGKLTLPLIHHLAVAEPSQRGRTLLLLERACDGAEAPALAADLDRTGSLAHARDSARRLVLEAKECLAVVPESPARRFLASLADAVVEREF